MKLFGREFHFSFRTRVPPEQMVCFGCGRDGSSVWKLIAGPAPTFICDECVTRADLALAGDGQDSSSGVLLELVEGRKCSFCGRPAVVATGRSEAGICRGCIGICQDIIREDRRLEVHRPRE